VATLATGISGFKSQSRVCTDKSMKLLTSVLDFGNHTHCAFTCITT